MKKEGPTGLWGGTFRREKENRAGPEGSGEKVQSNKKGVPWGKGRDGGRGKMVM